MFYFAYFFCDLGPYSQIYGCFVNKVPDLLFLFEVYHITILIRFWWDDKWLKQIYVEEWVCDLLNLEL
jgi:hypothetical protein